MLRALRDLLAELTRRRRLTPPPPAPDRLPIVQYGARDPDGTITWYPSEAAYCNDPRWNRGDPGYTVARQIDPDTGHQVPGTGIRRVYPKDRGALRGEDR